MEKIVVGIDEHAASQRAVDWVIDRARRKPVSVTLVTAFDLLLSDPATESGVLEVTRMRMLAASPTTSVVTRLVERSIMNELIEQSGSADLLVIGSHPRRHFPATLMGDLPAAIAKETKCATVIVPNDWTPSEGPVVVGVDGDSSDDAAEFAAHEARDYRAALHVMHSYNAPVVAFGPSGALATSPTDARELHQAVLDDACERIAQEVPGLPVLGHLRMGSAAEGLIATPDRPRMVVIGRHHWPALVGLFVDSTDRQLIASATAPICVVPPARAANHSLASRQWWAS